MNTRSQSPRPTRKAAASVPRTNGGTVATPPPPAPMARPVVHVPVVMAPDGDGGWNVRPCKPVILTGSDEISTAEAARLLGYSQGWISHLCDEGEFKTARKKGPGARAMWMLQRAEVLAFVFQRTE